MPSRSYIFPKDAAHLLAIAKGLDGDFSEIATPPPDEAPKLAPLASVHDLPKFMGISPSIIDYFLKKPSRHYRAFNLRKKSGGTRVINSPRTWLKVTQWWIYDNILVHHPYKECAYGFIRGRGPKENAEFHLGAAHVLNMDVENFFPSIGFSACKRAFQKLGYNNDVSEQLAWLSTLNNELPQGAPTSPAISNIHMEVFDDRVHTYCDERGMKYSRYADDITISSSGFISSDVVTMVSTELQRVGLNVNAKKTRFMGQGDRMEVTGYTINSKVQLSRQWRKLARAKIHRYLTDQEVDFDWHHIVGLFGAINNQQGADSTTLYRLALQAAGKGKPKKHS